MKLSLFSRISRFVAAITAAAVMAVTLPQVGFAASIPTFTFTTIKASESVGVHGKDFPANTDFTVRMDSFGDQAVDGIIVGTFNSGSGSFDVVFIIPSALKTEPTIAMRMDAAGGWFSYNWFTNQSAGAVVTPVPTTSTTGKPYIDVVAVDKNKAITVQAGRFPANQTFTIRVGPFKDFFKKYVVTGTVNSGAGGSFKFNVNLPESVKDIDKITIRLDSSAGAYAFNAFDNVTSGTVATPVVTPVPSTSAVCEITATSPTKTLKTREDFDAVWTVKNISGKTWEKISVDYKLVSGTQMQKYGKAFDMTQTVKSGESVKITVDMLAPTSAGSYTTTWAIVQGSTTLCSLPVTVVVK